MKYCYDEQIEYSFCKESIPKKFSIKTDDEFFCDQECHHYFEQNGNKSLHINSNEQAKNNIFAAQNTGFFY